MKIIYIHHAERDIDETVDWQEHDITENGVKQAEMLAEIITKDLNVKAIYTSPFKRCIKTAQIINKNINVEIIKEERFNEWNYDKSEGQNEFLKRNIDAINDICSKYNDDDMIICVSSGVNITAFILKSYGITPNDDVPISQAVLCSPVVFNIKKIGGQIWN